MTSGMTCKPGDIVGLPFPFSDLTSQKRRPVLVLTQADFRGDFMGLAVTSVLTEDNAVSIEAADTVSVIPGLPGWSSYHLAIFPSDF
jgi:mRNA interferase MazF